MADLEKTQRELACNIFDSSLMEKEEEKMVELRKLSDVLMSSLLDSQANNGIQLQD